MRNLCMDVLTKEQRSYNMSSIHGTNTRPELALRKRLHAKGLRYRCDYRVGKYSVDIAFPSKKIAVMVDGCFWHCCLNCFRMPETNVPYWCKKFKENKIRDRKASKALEKNGWVVLRFWEHELKETPQKTLRKVVATLDPGPSFLNISPKNGKREFGKLR